ncbi:hypothetical protein [Campylobacter hyointestinalis]|uniref:hypothetical protein n=1 Tax=Campylobacter hyointestinalis TaxID=198 RepID=UPI0007C8B042|nr:hypothetical protein [Campylobacter hyointestinalis]
MKKAMNEQRFIDTKTGMMALGDKEAHLISLENITDKTPKFVAEYSKFYKIKRGFHERSINSNGAWAITSSLPLINMPILSYIDELETPTLIVAGQDAHSLYFSQDAFMPFIPIFMITLLVKFHLINLGNFLKQIYKDLLNSNINS